MDYRFKGKHINRMIKHVPPKVSLIPCDYRMRTLQVFIADALQEQEIFSVLIENDKDAGVIINVHLMHLQLCKYTCK